MIENITSRLRYCSSLPTIPGIAMRIIELANRPDASMAEISDCVSMDPALSAKFLRMARSPLYLTRRTPTNVRQAISLMGTHAAIMIALSFSLVDSMRERRNGDGLKMDHFWRRSLLAALAARALGEKLGLRKHDDLFLAGLLQDVGMLAFDAMMPHEYEKVNRATLSHEELLQAERSVFGAGHDEVGYWLLKRWKLPDYLALACLTNHGPTQEKEAMSKMTSCVAVSNFIADHFLAPDSAALKRQAAQAAMNFLDMEEPVFSSVLDAVAARLASTEELFDIRLLDPIENDALMMEARDLQTLRQISRDVELERAALRDALTGAYNRNYLDNILQREFELASRNQWPLSVAMIDVDHLKNINTLYGRSVGDAVLVSIVRAMQKKIRPDDVLARFIGESFVLVMPDASLDSARHIVERLQESIGLVEHAQDRSKSIKATVSIGLAAHMDGGAQFDQSEALLHAAEEALLQDKHTGPNRVNIWSGHK